MMREGQTKGYISRQEARTFFRLEPAKSVRQAQPSFFWSFFDLAVCYAAATFVVMETLIHHRLNSTRTPVKNDIPILPTLGHRPLSTFSLSSPSLSTFSLSSPSLSTFSFSSPSLSCFSSSSVHVLWALVYFATVHHFVSDPCTHLILRNDVRQTTPNKCVGVDYDGLMIASTDGQLN